MADTAAPAMTPSTWPPSPSCPAGSPRSTTRSASTDLSVDRHHPHRPHRRLPAQRPQPGVPAARLVHLSAGGRRDAPRRLVRGRPGPLRQPLRAHPEPARPRSGPATAIFGGLMTPAFVDQSLLGAGPRPDVAVQARRRHQHRRATPASSSPSPRGRRPTRSAGPGHGRPLRLRRRPARRDHRPPEDRSRPPAR